MIEQAPSGAYVEEWRLVPGSRDHLGVTQVDDEMIYRAGAVAVFVRDRARRHPATGTVCSTCSTTTTGDRATIEALLDCEFSVAERDGDGGRSPRRRCRGVKATVLDVDG